MAPPRIVASAPRTVCMLIAALVRYSNDVTQCINAMFAICISEMVDTFQIDKIVSKCNSQTVGCMFVLDTLNV